MIHLLILAVHLLATIAKCIWRGFTNSPWTGWLLQDIELMPQHQDFGLKPLPRLEAVAQHAHEKEGNSEHPAIMF